jgi:hypothetical protein
MQCPLRPILARSSGISLNTNAHCAQGYGFCIKHVLEDPSSPWKQCGFISRSTQKQCTNPIPVTEKERVYVQMNERVTAEWRHDNCHHTPDVGFPVARVTSPRWP